MSNWLSYGGGVNSTALAILLHREGREFSVVFADTGAEKPRTLGFVEQHFRPWCEAGGIRFETVRSKRWPGGVIAQAEGESILPCRLFRWCTIQHKIKPIERLVGKDAHQIIGIDAGEAHRAENARYAGKEFPLIDRDIYREDCEEIIKAHGWPSPGKSGCWCCPFTRKGEIVKLPDCRLDTCEEMENRANTRWEKVARGHKPLYLWHDKPVAFWRNLAREYRENGTLFDDLREEPMPCDCYDG
jgi:hypothetical protein